MKYLKTSLERSIGETKSVTNAVRRGTPPHTIITKSINPRRTANNPVALVRRRVNMSDVPVDQVNKAFSKNER